MTVNAGNSHLNDILETLAQIQKSIDGITNAFPYQSTDTSPLIGPFWINEVRGGPASINGSHQQQITNNVRMVLALVPSTLQISPAEIQRLMFTWRDVVFLKFAHVRIGGLLDFVMDSWITSWDFMYEKQIGTGHWTCLQFNLQVREWFGQNISS